MAEDTNRPDAPSTPALAPPKGTWVDRVGRAMRGRDPGAVARRRLERALDEWLRDIDFEEVTLEDRIAFIESVVAHRIRRAIARGRLDLVPPLCGAGIRKAGEVGARLAGPGPIARFGRNDR